MDGLKIFMTNNMNHATLGRPGGGRSDNIIVR